MLPKFFRTYKHKQFTFLPRFYDKQKEELEERIKKAEAEVQGQKSGTYKKSIIRGSFRQAHHQRSVSNRNSLLRLVIIVVILLLLVYLLFTF